MDLPDRWRHLLARYWWLALVVAIVVALANIGSALTFFKDGILPRAAVVASALSVGEWAALASMALSLGLLAAILWSVRRTFPASASLGEPTARASRTEEFLRDEVARYRKLYEEAEDNWWTEDKDLKVTAREIPQLRMGDPLGVEVTVMSEDPIYPIQLRFWFSEEVKPDPDFFFTPDPSREHGPSDLDLDGGRRVTVRASGMVEVSYSGRILHLGGPTRGPHDVLLGAAQAKLSAYAASSDATSFRLLRVQRRCRAI